MESLTVMKVYNFNDQEMPVNGLIVRITHKMQNVHVQTVVELSLNALATWPESPLLLIQILPSNTISPFHIILMRSDTH